MRQLPPEPWPELPDGPIDHQAYGPEGTEWLFSVQSYLNRLTTGGFSQGFQGALKALTDEAKAVAVPGATTWGWRTPASAPNLDIGVRKMRWIHAEIIGKMGSEQVAHTLNFRTNPADVQQDAAAIATFAGQIRDEWVTFLAAGVNGNPMKKYLSADLAYTEVRAAYLEQTTAATVTTHKSLKTGRDVKDFHYPRPAVLVPTQFANFTVGNTGSDTPTTRLPWEVAMCLSLTTGLRGSRNNGRFYLGPLDGAVMNAAPGGLFTPLTAQGIGTAFAAFLRRLNTNTGNRVHVLSKSYATSVGVTGVRVGIVPDAQRRRRKSEAETYGATIAT